MKIKNIIFDLGGVILNIDFKLMHAAFERLGVKDFASVYALSRQDKIIDHFETGQITVDQFRQHMKTLFNLSISDEEFDNAWNAMLLDLPKQKADFIQQLREKHHLNIFLLSNTNEIHLMKIKKQHGQLFQTCFHKEYYSNEVGNNKPNPEIFLQVLNENDLLAEETLFLDDTLQHVEAARNLGLHAELITKDFTIFDILKMLKN